MRMRRPGQMTLEMAIVVAVAVAGMLAMQVYMRRALAGQLRRAADSFGSPYLPGHTRANETTEVTIDNRETTTEQGTATIEAPSARSFVTDAQVQARTEHTFDETVAVDPKAQLFE